MATKSRYEKISLWTQNLAMKKSRYAKILLWRNLAMKEPRHGKVSLWNGATRCLHMRYICETLPFRKLMFAISFRDICCYRRAPEKSCEIFVWNLCEILFLKQPCEAGRLLAEPLPRPLQQYVAFPHVPWQCLIPENIAMYVWFGHQQPVPWRGSIQKIWQRVAKLLRRAFMKSLSTRSDARRRYPLRQWKVPLPQWNAPLRHPMAFDL